MPLFTVFRLRDIQIVEKHLFVVEAADAEAAQQAVDLDSAVGPDGRPAIGLPQGWHDSVYGENGYAVRAGGVELDPALPATWKAAWAEAEQDLNDNAGRTFSLSEEAEFDERNGRGDDDDEDEDADGDEDDERNDPSRR